MKRKITALLLSLLLLQFRLLAAADEFVHRGDERSFVYADAVGSVLQICGSHYLVLYHRYALHDTAYRL